MCFGYIISRNYWGERLHTIHIVRVRGVIDFLGKPPKPTLQNTCDTEIASVFPKILPAQSLLETPTPENAIWDS